MLTPRKSDPSQGWYDLETEWHITIQDQKKYQSPHNEKVTT